MRLWAIVLVCWLLVACSPSSPVPAPVAPPRPVDQAAQQSLDALVDAVRSHAKADFDRGISSRDPSFATTASMVYHNLSALPLTALAFRVLTRERDLSPARRALLGPDAFVRQVSVSWRVSGDGAPAQHLLWLAFLPEGSATTVAGIIDGPGEPAPRPIWLTGPVAVQRSATTTVVAGVAVPGSRWLDSGNTAVAAVRTMVPPGVGDRWNRRLVVEVPATAAEFERVLGVAAGSYASIAAVAWPEGPDPATAAVRIVVNAELAGRLDRQSLQVLMTHEVTHVATTSVASPAPTWLIEGYADYLAYEAHPETAQQAEAELLAQLEARGAPRALPKDAEFTPGAADLRWSYTESWLACRFLAHRSSSAALGRFYRLVDGGMEVDQALQSATGLTLQQFTAGWSDSLIDAAQRGSSR